MAISYLHLSGEAVEARLEELGKLRISVFLEYPYLYEGTLDYEREYLQTYVRCPDSLVVLAMDEDKAVGATTCIPMLNAEPEFQAPFLASGAILFEYCYFGESILLPEYRGQGIGKEFMKRREAHARNMNGVKFSTFCAVNRAADDPRRPSGYQPLDEFWTRQGYQKHPELRAEFRWKEIGDEVETPKEMIFWIKDLTT